MIRREFSCRWSLADGLTLRNEWAEACAAAGQPSGGCGGGALRPQPSPIHAESAQYTDHGDVGHAMYRAAQIAHIAQRWTPPAVLNAQSCGMPGGPCRVNLANGNFLAHNQIPSSSDFDPVPILTYNSRSTQATEFGYDWFGTYKQSVAVNIDDPNSADLTTGPGSVLVYTNKDAAGQYTPPDGARNALKRNVDDTWTETQPDGLKLQYNSDGRLARLEDVFGGRWTLSHDAGNRVTRIDNSAAGLTSFSYDASDKIRRIEDSSGRITSFTVDGNGDLTQRTSPRSASPSIAASTTGRQADRPSVSFRITWGLCIELEGVLK